MTLKYWVTEVHFVTVKDGIAWQRCKDLSNPPYITACDCCVPRRIKDELKELGIDLIHQTKKDNNPTHPTEEEWLSIKLAAQM